MKNSFLNGLQSETNFVTTENGAVAHKSTLSAVLDMFALGGSYRNRSDEDCILLFKNALEEDEILALKCLFYLRDIRGGQGERRFFRVCYKWLAEKHSNIARRNFELISEYGRYDDVIYSLIGTPLEKNALNFIKNQLALDIQCKTPSLLAKWLPSENASAEDTKKMGNIIRRYLGMTHKEYRKTLSILRERINVLERLMSANRWNEIEFDKIPSKAGLIYRNAFARRDIIAKKYEAFAKNENTKVNAAVLNPVDIAEKVFSNYLMEDTERAMLQKYWDNQIDYYNGREENGIAIVDVSGSMRGTAMNAAVSMGAYIAERGHGPFANHFITFSSNPQLVKFEGIDIFDKFTRCIHADWGMNTNIEAVFNMMLNVAIKNHTAKEDMPVRLYIFSDMEFDRGLTSGPVAISRWNGGNHLGDTESINTLLEDIAKRWAEYGYELPKVIFWNLDARQNNIPALGSGFSYVSGFSMNMVECILSGKDGVDLMLEKLNSERYEAIH